MVLLNSTSELAQVSRFGAVGIFNTAFDFLLFNALSTKKVGLTKLQANTISTTITMIVSFFLNKATVFHAVGNPSASQVVSFFVVTAFGLYVLQNSVIYIVAQRWQWPRQVVESVRRWIGLPGSSTEVLLKNGAKVAGTMVSLVWNYVMYKQVVFKI